MKNMDILERLRNKNINSGNFPIIDKMKEAILFFSPSDSEVNYDGKNNTFVVTYMTPFPVRDSGGSIDSMDFREENVLITFQQAYKTWLDMLEVLRINDYEAIAPVPWLVSKKGADFDIDLPF